MQKTRPARRRARSRSSTAHVAKNLRFWNRTAEWYERHNASALLREEGKAWGMFRVPERELQLLGKLRGKRVLELGCGAADWSVALAREGARVVGLDFSKVRLGQARRRMERASIRFPLVEASAEAVPFPGDWFDLVLSDYGATAFTDPHRTVPEVARVLRPGGVFVFAHSSPFRSVSMDFRSDRLERRLVRPYFGPHVLRTPETIEFQLPYGEWIRLFNACGLRVDRLIEPAAPIAPQSTYLSKRDQRWARHWPVESIWRLTKVGAREPAI